MAKFSVHVPDDLWEQVRASAGDRNTSQLVQEGLRRLVAEEHGDPSYVGRPEGVEDQLQELRGRLAAEARCDYERGYRIALDAASAMSLHVINELVDKGFDLRRWIGPFKAGYVYDHLQKQEPVPAEEIDDFWERLKESAEQPPPHDESWRNDDNQWWWLWKSAEALGDIAAPIDFDAYSFAPTLARQRGFVDAMRDVWDALEQGRIRGDARSGEESNAPPQDSDNAGPGRG